MINSRNRVLTQMVIYIYFLKKYIYIYNINITNIDQQILGIMWITRCSWNVGMLKFGNTLGLTINQNNMAERYFQKPIKGSKGMGFPPKSHSWKVATPRTEKRAPC
jgi:hypothetical protein